MMSFWNSYLMIEFINEKTRVSKVISNKVHVTTLSYLTKKKVIMVV
jgi:hypothetical protein